MSEKKNPAEMLEPITREEEERIRRSALYEEIRKLKVQGMTYRAIAKKLKTSTATVQKALG